MTGPLVSIIIPCYNAEPFVRDAVESALGQTHREREIVVVDDGSTDRSLDVIRSFGDAIRWVTGPNRGGGAARNAGLSLAQGEFVQFLDADDFLLPGKVEREVALLKEADADVCVSRFSVIENGTVSRCGPTGAPSQSPIEWLLSADIRIVPLYRTVVVKDVEGFDATLPCCQDLDLNLRIAECGVRYVFSGDVGYEVRRRTGSVSYDEVRLYRVMVNVLLSAARRLELKPNGRERQIASIAGRIASCGRWLLRLGDTDGGMAAFAVAKAVHLGGGLRSAYSTPARTIRAVLGVARAERVLWRLRCLRAGAAPTESRDT